jgi:pimeloyl-ACP methyl ester carboxylesterase
MAEAVDCVYESQGEGPAIVFVHGIGSRRTAWRAIEASLGAGYHCVDYDLRGHGDSPLGTLLPFGLDELVVDLERVRIRAGLERIHIVGHSLGGMIGPAYARRYPDRVASVTLLSTAAFRTEDDSAKVWAVVNAMLDKGIGPVLDTLTARWFTDAFVASYPDRIEARKRQVLETPADVFINVFRIYAGTEMAPWLHEVHAPCLVLTGENDGGCNPRLNRQIAAALPDSRLVILDGLKHSILAEAPDQVARHLREFLDSLGGKA